MTAVRLAKNRDEGIDDAVRFDQAIDAYKAYFSEAFLDTWPDAYDRYQAHPSDRGIELVAGEEADEGGAVTLIRDYDNGKDDGHYLGFAVDVYKDRFSAQFNAMWPTAWQAFVDGQEEVVLCQGVVIESADPDATLPDVDIDLPRPPEPTQLPADPPPPEATQLPANQEPPKPTQY